MKSLSALGVSIACLLSNAAFASPTILNDAQLSGIVAGENFQVVGEVSNQTGVAPTTDPLLVNAWGLSQAPGGPLWVSNNGTGTSTLYDSSFAKLPLTVGIPAPGGGPGAPTGTVFTSLAGNSFDITSNGVTGHSIFLFDTEDGTIVGWSPGVNLTEGVIAVDQSAEHAAFKGLAVSMGGRPDREDQSHVFKFPPNVMSQQAPVLFAADFVNNRVDMFNGSFQQTGAFTDPTLPAGYAPFNVQVLGGRLFVTFAKQRGGIDEMDGAGLGYVDVFNTDGHFEHRLVSNGPLNAPWGLAIAPKSFGSLAGALLVGNFGDGAVNAFNPDNGKFLGQITSNGSPISIDGLWALTNGPDGTVIFSSGPDGEANGLVGVIRPQYAQASWAFRDHASR